MRKALSAIVASTPIASSTDERVTLPDEQAAPALEKRDPVRITLPINSVNRATGAMLSGEIAKRFGHRGLPNDTVHVSLKGTAGQSFGAWLARGVPVCNVYGATETGPFSMALGPQQARNPRSDCGCGPGPLAPGARRGSRRGSVLR